MAVDGVPEYKPRSIVEWDEPPPQAPDRRRVWDAVAAELRANPGRWARMEPRKSAVAAATLTYQIRSGEKASFRPQGKWEARYEDRTVWVRYVGDTRAEDAT